MRNLPGIRVVPVPPLFGLTSTVSPLFSFQDENVKNLLSLLSTEAICGDQITVKPFSDPAGRAHDTLPKPQSDEEASIAIRSPSELVPLTS